MVSKVKIGDVELILSLPDEIPNMEWIGGNTYMTQLLASWILVDQKKDIPMNPQILGKPGVGKTTLAYSASKKLGLPVYIFQCTVDTRPEDLIISPVIGENNTIKYHASSLVTAMIEGGICILDEANRMSEKSWASLAPLLDQRRYIESIIAGIKVKAHPNFRICCTMNEDSSTFEVPEYIHSRLQPQIFIDFPEKDEEFKILEFNLPFAKKDLILYAVEFLQEAHSHNKDFTARDGINICRYYLKMSNYSKSSTDKINEDDNKEEKNSIDFYLFRQSVKQILNSEGLKFLYEKEKLEKKSRIDSPLKKVFNKLMEIDEEELLDENFEDLPRDKRNLNNSNDEDFLFLDNEDDDKSFSDDFFLDEENTTDVINIVEKKNEEEDPYENLEPFFIDELDDMTEDQDPNEIIRKFLAKKSKKKSKKQDNDNKDANNKEKK